MQQQAIWKIENGNPPRKISYGEAVALSKVFGIEDVADLGKPPGEVADELADQIIGAYLDMGDSRNRLADLIEDAAVHAQLTPSTREQMTTRLRSWARDLEEWLAGLKELIAELEARGGELPGGPDKDAGQ
jgi:hypothetical protein